MAGPSQTQDEARVEKERVVEAASYQRTVDLILGVEAEEMQANKASEMQLPATTPS